MQTIEFPDMKEELEYKYYCGGKWEKSTSGQTISIRNPYNDDLVGKIQACSKEEVDKVITTAQENLDCWKDTPLNERIEVLRKAARIMREWSEPLGQLLMKEIGKPIKSAISEIVRTAEIFEGTSDFAPTLGGETIMGDAFEGFTKEKISENLEGIYKLLPK